MAVVAFIVLLLAIPAVILGIVYVPRHDGRLLDTFLAVILPSAAVSWALWQLLRRCPKPQAQPADDSGEKERTEKERT